jgi:hypothetical protein
MGAKATQIHLSTVPFTTPYLIEGAKKIPLILMKIIYLRRHKRDYNN